MTEETIIPVVNSTANLFKALCKAQKEFKEPKRTKKAYNYNYAPMDEVRNATIEGLINNGLSIIQFPINDGDKVGVQTILAHESGESIENTFSITLSKNDPQIAGSAITYIRRYAYLGVLGLAPEDDDGAAAMPTQKKTTSYSSKRNTSKNEAKKEAKVEANKETKVEAKVEVEVTVENEGVSETPSTGRKFRRNKASA